MPKQPSDASRRAYEKAHGPTEHVPGQEAFPGLSVVQPPPGVGQPFTDEELSRLDTALDALPRPDDMTPQPIHAGPPQPEFSGDARPPGVEPTTAISIQVTGTPTPARLLDAALTLIAQSMAADGWGPQAILGAVHNQVDAALNLAQEVPQ